ncbi:MAG: hypothetical protein J6Q81_07700 [Lentisphaeria bacterium]|nr:hypothetical protein [Lentisphaeria bacterium]
MSKWYWSTAQAPAELHYMLSELGELFDLVQGSGSKTITFERIAGEGVISEVEFVSENSAVVRYNTVSAAARGVGSVMANIAGRQSTSFTMLGIMVDLSRNLVFTVPAMKKMFRKLALLGFNTVLLYCEDTYELPGEPAFGMMRGRYTAEEIRAMDDAAAAVGIELMGCIQTLGHMAQILRWNGAYGKIKDTASVMRTDVEETHTLIGKMLDFWSENLRSRRIHVGMDETHDLGRGKYLDEKGYTGGFELFTKQLNLVNEACVKRGLKPMIWSDMFFRLGNPQQLYYDLNSNIPEFVRKSIPENMQLVYWDYYRLDQDFYEKFIDMHRDLNGEPLMGAGVWIWSRLWYDHQHSAIVNRACINGCRAQNLKEIFFTMWGDDGAICHWESAWTGLTEASDLAFGVDDENITAERYKALTGSDYNIDRLPGKLHCREKIGDLEFWGPNSTDLGVFWDDLLLGLAWRDLEVRSLEMPQKLTEHFAEILKEITPYKDKSGNGANLKYGYLITRFLHDKMVCRGKLLAAYKIGDKAALKALADTEIPALAELFAEVMSEFRKQWLAVGKVFGLETMQHRMAGQKERIYEAARRINEYLSGSCTQLEELEQPLPEFRERMVIYADMASGSVLV